MTLKKYSDNYSRVYVEVTNACNKSCSFCPKHERELRMMTVDEFDLVTSKLIGVTEYLYYHVMGEPLTHPHITELIKIASDKGFKSVITTNGSLLDILGDKLIASGVYKINLSIHSFEGNSLEEHKKYMDTCFDFADKASREGILIILRLWNSGHDNGLNDQTLEILRERFADGEWKTVANGARIRHKLHLEYGERFSWPDMASEEVDDSVFCYGLNDHFSVLCDGTVVPCCLDRNGDISLGNIYEQDICEILCSPLAEQIRNGFAEHVATQELCRRCGYAKRFK
ncbi:MAG: radical SAM protein [Clostridia bacterium]|nr:radical SAM protein [Clostridia bacterium]